MLVSKLLAPIDFYSINFFFHTMDVSGYSQLFGYQHSSEYLLLCSAEDRNSRGLGTTRRRVKDETEMFIYG